LDRLDQGRYSKDHFVDFIAYELRNRYYVIIITQENVLFINPLARKPIWRLGFQYIKKIKKYSNGISIHYEQPKSPQFKTLITNMISKRLRNSDEVIHFPPQINIILIFRIILW
jgi:hypothetical protein